MNYQVTEFMSKKVTLPDTVRFKTSTASLPKIERRNVIDACKFSSSYCIRRNSEVAV